jgi:hypothetical protein
MLFALFLQSTPDNTPVLSCSSFQFPALEVLTTTMSENPSQKSPTEPVLNFWLAEIIPDNKIIFWLKNFESFFNIAILTGDRI